MIKFGSIIMNNQGKTWNSIMEPAMDHLASASLALASHPPHQKTDVTIGKFWVT
jgi:hypothetical protein